MLLIRGTNADGSLLAPRLTAEVAPAQDNDGWPRWQRGGQRQTLMGWGRLNWFGKDPNWKDQLDFRGNHDVERNYGEWNLLECRCDRGHIQVMLNGTLINEAFETWPQNGQILLQCEGSEIFFRRLELQGLSQ